MPLHDWTRVEACIYYDFHLSWVTRLSHALNQNLLPSSHYALIEEYARRDEPEVPSLRAEFASCGAMAEAEPELQQASVTVAPPKVRHTAMSMLEQHALAQNSVVIREAYCDQAVALIEIVSPANKSTRANLRTFVEKAGAVLNQGCHLMVIDLHAPTRRDPNGIHGEIWQDVADDSYRLPDEKPLAIASYDAGPPRTAYVEPVAVGDTLPDMPLFLEPGRYITVPLESTYQSAWQGVPRRWRRVLEPSDS